MVKLKDAFVALCLLAVTSLVLPSVNCVEEKAMADVEKAESASGEQRGSKQLWPLWATYYMQQGAKSAHPYHHLAPSMPLTPQLLTASGLLAKYTKFVPGRGGAESTLGNQHGLNPWKYRVKETQGSNLEAKTGFVLKSGDCIVP